VQPVGHRRLKKIEVPLGAEPRFVRGVREALIPAQPLGALQLIEQIDQIRVIAGPGGGGLGRADDPLAAGVE
jgi:hypothetical protein